MFIKVILPIIICFVPVILCFLICKKMQVKALHLGASILLGLVAVLPISFIQYLIPIPDQVLIGPVIFSLLKSLFLYGFVEEGIKALLISPLPCKKEETPLKFLLLAFMFGITVGGFEAVVYYLDKLQRATNRGASILYLQIFLRMFSSYIIHMTCAGLSGLFIYTIAHKNTKLSYLISAILIHGLYDFFVAFQNNLKWFSVGVILLAIVQCHSNYSTLTDPKDKE